MIRCNIGSFLEKGQHYKSYEQENELQANAWFYSIYHWQELTSHMPHLIGKLTLICFFYWTSAGVKIIILIGLFWKKEKMHRPFVDLVTFTDLSVPFSVTFLLIINECLSAGARFRDSSVKCTRFNKTKIKVRVKFQFWNFIYIFIITVLCNSSAEIKMDRKKKSFQLIVCEDNVHSYLQNNTNDYGVTENASSRRCWLLHPITEDINAENWIIIIIIIIN